MKRSDRQSRCIAPAALRPILQQPLPPDLASRGPASLRVLADLDWAAARDFEPKDVAKLDQLVLAAVSSQIQVLPRSIRFVKLGSPLPDSLDALDLQVRTQNCLGKAGYRPHPERLADTTVEDLLAIRGFGAVSLIDLLGAIEQFRIGVSPPLDLDPKSNGDGRSGANSPEATIADESTEETIVALEFHRLSQLDVKGLASRDLVLPRSIRAAKLGPLRLSSLRHLRLKPRTYSRMAKVGYLDHPERLAESTIENLLAIRGFGVLSVVDLLRAIEPYRSARKTPAPTGSLDQSRHSVDRCRSEARRLAAMDDAALVRASDPRLGDLMLAVGSHLTGGDNQSGAERSSARDIAHQALNDQHEVADPAGLAVAIRALRTRIDRLRHMSLDQELAEFLDGLTKRNRRLIARRFGWDGKAGSTLEDVGAEFRMTRERVRQIERSVITGITKSGEPVFAPSLDRALSLIVATAPASVDELTSGLTRAGITKLPFDVDAIGAAAMFLGRAFPFTTEMTAAGRVVMQAASARLVRRIRTLAHRSIEHWGVGNIDDIAAQAGDVGRSFVAKILQAESGFSYLDEEKQWFWISSVARNRLLNQISKVMSVAPRIHVSELRSGVSRHHRMKGLSPPRRVLLALCNGFPGYRVDGDYVIADPPPNYQTVLADIERRIAMILKEQGPLMVGTRLEKLVVAAGIKRSTFQIYLGYSPIIAKYARGVYGLRGVDFPAGAAERLVPSMKGRSRVVQDHGWTPDGKIWIAYKLTSASVASGVVTLPASLKAILAGEFELRSHEGIKMGTFVAKSPSAWGLGPFFRRRGGEGGDHLVLLFDLSRRSVTAQLGDEELQEQFATQTQG